MDIVTTLRDLLPDDAVVTDPDVLEGHRRDEAGLVPAGTPLAAVFPSGTAEVRAVLRAAHDAGVAVVPRGEGTGLSGGANAIDGAITLSTRRMDRVLEVDHASSTVRVQPGVVTGDLKRHVAAQGLWYAPDPASQDICSIGGNLATNAGGLCCVKYGVTRDAVLALEVVLADGRVVHAGNGTVKDVAGYDLVGLFVGSEGTLGVITEATLRLRPARPAPTTMVATFDDLVAAGRAITDIATSTVPALLEVLDRTTIRAVDDHTRMGLDRDAAALLIAQSDLGGDSAAAQVAAMGAACESAGATWVAVSSDPDEADQLLAARRMAYPALEGLGATLLDDVGVPLGRVADLLAAVEAIAADTGAMVGTFGHAGDGNMHPTVVFDRHDDEAAAVARDAFDRILDAAVGLGGTITGEHGVGLLKQPHLARTMDPGARTVQAAIKQALDPRGILNPGRGVA